MSLTGTSLSLLWPARNSNYSHSNILMHTANGSIARNDAARRRREVRVVLKSVYSAGSAWTGLSCSTTGLSHSRHRLPSSQQDGHMDAWQTLVHRRWIISGLPHLVAFATLQPETTK
jgi:hypothetical protein